MGISRFANVYEECENPLLWKLPDRDSQVILKWRKWCAFSFFSFGVHHLKRCLADSFDKPVMHFNHCYPVFQRSHVSELFTSKYCNLRTRPVILITLKRNRNAKRLQKHLLLLLQLPKHGEQEFSFPHLLVQKIMCFRPARNSLCLLEWGIWKDRTELYTQR